MGSLYQKSDKKGSWIFSYYIDGKRKQISKGLSNIGNLDRKQHRRLLDKYETKYEGVYNHFGDKIPSIRKTIDDIISERTTRVSLQTLSPKTLGGDISRFKIFWEFLKDNYKLNELDVTKIDTKMLNDYMEYCRVVKGNSSTNIHNNMNVIRLLVNWIVDKGYVDENPMKKITIPKPRKRGVEDIPSDIEYNKLTSYLEDWVDGYLSNELEFSLINTLTYIQTKTGMRGGEVKLMKWKRGKNDIGKNHSYSYVYLSLIVSKQYYIYFLRSLIPD